MLTEEGKEQSPSGGRKKAKKKTRRLTKDRCGTAYLTVRRGRVSHKVQTGRKERVFSKKICNLKCEVNPDLRLCNDKSGPGKEKLKTPVPSHGRKGMGDVQKGID